MSAAVISFQSQKRLIHFYVKSCFSTSPTQDMDVTSALALQANTSDP